MLGNANKVVTARLGEQCEENGFEYLQGEKFKERRLLALKQDKRI